jgi:hypothetical protein
MLAGQRADRLALGVGDAVDQELGERALIVGDAQGGVLAVDEFPRGDDDGLQHLADGQVPGDREHRRTQRIERALLIDAVRAHASP